jgi:hypothetical protein
MSASGVFIKTPYFLKDGTVMKKLGFIRIVAVCLFLVTLLALVSCGGSSIDKIERNLKTNAALGLLYYETVDEDELYDFSEEIADMIGYMPNLKQAYVAEDPKDYEEIIIIEFANPFDVEKAYHAFSEDFANDDEWKVKREGNILIFGANNLVDMLLK